MTTDRRTIFHLEDEPGDRAFVGYALRLLSNAQVERMCGPGGAAIVGETDHDVFAPGLAPGYSANDRRVVTTGKALHVEKPSLIPEDATSCEQQGAPARRNAR